MNTSTLFRHSVLVTLSLLVVGCLPQIAGDAPAVGSQVTDEPVFVTPDSLTVVEAATSPPVPTPAPSPTSTVPDEELPLAETSYRIPLTIRHVTQTEVTLFFELDRPSLAILVVRPREAAAQTVEVKLDPAQTRHLVTVGDLRPDTGYEVVVALEAGTNGFQQPAFLSRAWGPVSFQTASESGSLRVGVVGDASFGDPVTSAIIEQMAGAGLDFALHTGDVVDETEQGVDPFQSYAAKFYTPFAPLLAQMPVYTVIGNHDYDADIRWQDAPFYYHVFPPFPDPSFPTQADMPRNQYYAFVYQDVQFLMLDSQVFFGQPGREEQEIWLAERLADPRFRMTIPVFHVSPFSSSSVHPTDSLPVRYEWTPLFAAANVPVVFSGHFHQYERLASNDVTYIVSGGGSATLYAPGELLPENQVFRRASHYVLLDIGQNGIQLSAYSSGGEVIDQVRLPPR